MKLIFTLCSILLTFNITYAQTGGDLDANYGSSGFSFLDFEPDSSETMIDMIPTKDGKMISIGYILQSNNYDILVSRINTNGSPDISFGFSGYVTLDINDKSLDRALNGVVLSDGKIVIIGYSVKNQVTHGFIMRLNADGSLDKSFGKGSKGYTLFNSADNTMFRPESIVKFGGSFFLAGITIKNGNPDYSVYKFTSGGVLDQSFGNSGSTVFSVHASDNTTSMAISSTGKIAVGGYSHDNGRRLGVVIQFKNNGSIDKTFNTTGVRIVDYGTDMNTISDLAYDQNDQLVAVGFEGENPDNDGMILRFTKDGKLDNTFGTKGAVFSDIGTTTSVITNQVNILKDNSILASGYLYQNGKSKVYSILLTETGKPHAKFGTGGDVDYDMPVEVASMFIGASAVQPDGNIVLAGSRTKIGFGEKHTFFVRLIGPDLSSSTSVKETRQQQLVLYPNPIKNSFSISHDQSKVEKLVLTDLSGKVIQSWQNQNGVYELSDQIQNGVYFISVTREKSIYYSKVLISK